MKTPILIFDRRVNQRFAKQWDAFFPAEVRDDAYEVCEEVNDVKFEISRGVKDAAKQSKFLLVYCHLSWLAETNGKSSLEKVAQHLPREKDFDTILLVIVSEGGLQSDSEEEKYLLKELKGIEGLYWVTSRLDFPSGSSPANPSIAEKFVSHLLELLPEIVALDPTSKQSKFREIFEQYEFAVNPDLKTNETESIVVPYGSGLEYPRITQDLRERDHFFRLYLLVKLLRVTNPKGAAMELRKIAITIGEMFPEESINENISELLVSLRSDNGVEYIRSLSAKAFKGVIAELRSRGTP